jgi:NAD(P)-dependent dehydrogenase (short-subunit alcohol dehydrogenase family)
MVSSRPFPCLDDDPARKPPVPMSDPTRPLENLHAIVTGAGRGIGAAVVRRLAARGAAVSLVGRRAERLDALTEELAGQHPQRFHVAPADMTDEAQVTRAFTGAREALGPFDILVNNAGIIEPGPFLDQTPEDWQRHFDVNVSGAARATRHALPDMLAKGWGRIVNVSSISGLMGVTHVAAYSATKHALVGFTRSLALEVAKSGVTVNAVCPSYVDTDMMVGLVEDLAEDIGRSEEVTRAVLMRNIPVGRMITPDEVASAVAWLCDPEQAMVTGHPLVISGGAVV